jgi:GTP-binding protein
MEDADLLVFVVDAKSGLTAADYEVADLVRRTRKPVLLVANKADNERRSTEATEFFELGLGEPYAISALNGRGIGDLLDLVDETVVLPPEPEEEEATLRVAIIGRPNVGKSALLNAILGEERVIVSEIAGTTRDAIDTPFEYRGHQITLIDTAGIRRPGRLEGSIEHYSVQRAKAALERSDVAIVVFDASVALRAQDLHIIGMALEANTGIVLFANKWDLIEEIADRKRFVASIQRRLNFAPWVPLVIGSALQGKGTDDVLLEVLASGEQRRIRVPTAELNAIIRGAIARRPPPIVGRHRLKLLYATQPETEPPLFVFFVNDAGLIQNSYKRYLENNLRAAFGYRGAGLRMIFRTRGGS